MKYLATNRRANAEYSLQDRLEAGLVLNGNEVKSVKAGNISLKEAYVQVTPNQEAYLLNAHISPYQKAKDYDPIRSRKLLLNKSELKNLFGKTSQKGLTIIPLAIYAKKGYLKLLIAVAAKKKKRDRRQDLRQRAHERDIDQQLSGR